MVTTPQCNIEQQLIYKCVNGRDVILEYFPPTKAVYDRAPLFVLIPGGGWMISNAMNMYNMSRPAAETLRAAGFAVAAISYRNRSKDNATMDEILSDIFDAAAYLAHHAAVLKLDAHSIYAGGHSAGGHLALMLAYAPCNFLQESREYNDAFTVRGAAPLSPVCDAPVLDGAFAATSKNPPRSSPLWWARQGAGVPTLFCVGDADALVPYERHSLPTHEALLRHGIRSEVAISHNGGHCFEGMNGNLSNPAGVAIIRQSGEFILNLHSGR